MLHKLIQHMIKTTKSPVRIYDDHLSIKEYFGTHKDSDFLLHDSVLLENITAHASSSAPGLYKLEPSIYYGTVQYGSDYIIIGPVNCDYSIFPKSDNLQMMYCEYSLFCEELLLLHNLLNNASSTREDLTEHNYNSLNLTQTVEKELTKVYFKYQKKGIVHNSYDKEVRELNSIREGNVEKLMKCLDEASDGEYGTLSRDPLRSARNLAIAALTLASRAAIDGGMSPEESFSLNDSYILQIDSATTHGQISELSRKAKKQYASIVHSLNRKKKTHILIEKAKVLIYKHMHQKIVIEELAQELQITPEYLSSLFHREEGITLTDYIMKTKIHYTENLLIYSNYSIQDISCYFGFSSQSHYGKVFKKWKHMTPKQYRNRYGVREFNKDFSHLDSI